MPEMPGQQDPYVSACAALYGMHIGSMRRRYQPILLLASPRSGLRRRWRFDGRNCGLLIRGKTSCPRRHGRRWRQRPVCLPLPTREKRGRTRQAEKIVSRARMVDAQLLHDRPTSSVQSLPALLGTLHVVVASWNCDTGSDAPFRESGRGSLKKLSHSTLKGHGKPDGFEAPG